MKRIAIVLNSYHNAGPSNVMKAIMNYLNQYGHHIILITLLKKNSAEAVNLLKQKGIAVFELNFQTKNKAFVSAPKAIHRIVQEQNIDIIHSNSLISDAVSILSRTEAKHTCTLHNNMFYNYYGHYGKVFSGFMVKLHLSILRCMDACVCCSKYIYNDIKKYIERTVIIRNGIESNTAFQLTKEELRIPIDSLIYVYAGVLNPRKNVLWLAKNFSRLHNDNEYLLILGEGQDKAEILNINDSNIKVYGFVDNPVAYFHISDVYVSASLSEGFSLSILEALSSGNYLLLSDIPSHKELIDLCGPSYVGNLFCSGNVDSFFRSFIDLRTHINSRKRKSVQKIASDLFSAETMAKEYEKFYLQLN